MKPLIWMIMLQRWANVWLQPIWDRARVQIVKVQSKQKQQHAKDFNFQVKERVFVHMPASG